MLSLAANGSSDSGQNGEAGVQRRSCGMVSWRHVREGRVRVKRRQVLVLHDVDGDCD